MLSIGRWSLLLACVASVIASHAAERPRIYQIHYGAEFRPKDGVAAVTIRVEQPERWLRQVTFTAPPDRYRDFEGDGSIRVVGDQVSWQPPRKGGELRYLHIVDHRRPGAGYDARMTSDWAVLKADKLIPPASARTVRGARSAATLELTGPEGWLFQTRYARVRNAIAIDDPERNFDRPTGWMILGHLATRREDIAGRYVLVGSPVGENFRQIELLAFLRWNLPVVVELLPLFPERFLIVSGSPDMWRGGLSGAASLYLHRDRPLISQNVTSPLLHELIHMGSRLSGKGGGDWIVEGLAEYYSVEVMRRSGTISEHRFARSMTRLEQWADRDGGCLSTTSSTGPHTARAAVVLHTLNREINARTGGRRSLDDVFGPLRERRQAVTESSFTAVVEDLLGGTSTTLARLPRCQASSPRSVSSSWWPHSFLAVR